MSVDLYSNQLTHGSYSCAFDDIKALLKMLCILFRVFAADQDLDRNFAPLQRLKVFGWNISVQFNSNAARSSDNTYLFST